MPDVLSRSTTLIQFDNGYWYASEIRVFAKEIGIPSYSKLRKDELEEIIRHFLRTGKVKAPRRKTSNPAVVKDSEKGLSLKQRVVNYTNNPETKAFIDKEAVRMEPGLKLKSGARYRLNRWREEQITKGRRITYGDLVKQFIKLNQVEGPFPRVPSGRYINFLSNYLAHEEHATRAGAIRAWHTLKKLDIPKNYKAWKKHGTG